MTYSRPVTRVIELLQANGYELLAGQLRIGTLTFDFTATLYGTNRSFDLVLIADTITEPGDGVVLRQIEALGRALDMVESRRSATLVVVGPPLSDIIAREASRVCRVLSIGTPTGIDADQRVRDGLSVLLPLNLPSAGITNTRPLDMLRQGLGEDASSEIELLLGHAADGPAAVEKSLRRWLASALPEDDQ